MSYKGIASEQSSAAPDIETITGDTGGPVGPDGAFNVNLVGVGGVSVDGNPGTNTLSISSPAGSAPITKYVVAQDGSGDYTTIQAALDAANLAGGGQIFIRPGTYTENLTFYDKIDLWGSSENSCIISGIHTPPSSGSLNLFRCTFQSSTDILNSSATGTTSIIMEDCTVNCTNGYTFNLPNWTGSIGVFDIGNFGTDDGFFLNNNGASFFAYSARIGNGTAKLFNSSGNILIYDCDVDCPFIFQTGTAVDFRFSSFNKNLFFSSSGDNEINHCFLRNTAGSAITISGINSLTLSNCTIDTATNPAIGGGSSNPLNLNNVNFVNNSNISAGFTNINSGIIKGGNFISQFIVDPVGENGAYKTIQSAINAADAAGGGTVYIYPGTYTESLTLKISVDLVGAVGDSVNGQVTITGQHQIPTAAGKISCRNILFNGSADPTFTNSALSNTDISFVKCDFTLSAGGHSLDVLTNGYAGTLNIKDCNAQSTNDGFLRTSGSSANFIIQDSLIGGTGTTNSMTISSANKVEMWNCQIGSRLFLGGLTDSFFDLGCVFLNTVTFSTQAQGEIKNCTFDPTTGAAFNYQSNQPSILSEVSINSSNDPAITGSGTGAIKIGSATFLDNENISGSLTLDENTFFRTGEIIAKNIQRQEFSGIYSWSGAGSYYSTSGKDFTLLRGGIGYIKNREVSWAGSQTVSSLTAGNTHYIYIDNTGTIGSTTTRSASLFFDNIVLFEVLVDSAVTANLIVVREDHPYNYSTSVSNWAHYAAATLISNLDKGANIILNGTKGIEIDVADKLLDHGIETTIPDSGGTAETFSFMYTNASNKWIRNTTANTFPSDWNNGGTITALGTNKFGIFTLYISKDDLNSSIPTYYAVYDTSEYNSLALARAAIAAETVAIATNELKELEFARLGYVIKQESTDTIADVIINKDTLIGTIYNSWEIINDTSNFSGLLSSSDKTVQMALDTIDDFYETGTFTPVLEFGGASTGITYAIQSGNYTRIGDLVHIFISLNLSDKGTATGSSKITGLPFTIGKETHSVLGNWENLDITTNYNTISANLLATATYIKLREIGDNISGNNLTNVNFNNNSILNINCAYKI
jgi:hypothetical protein